jgi:hypothetical protein
METSTGVFGLSPSTTALVLIIVAIALYAAYTYYYGGVTVPLPSYKSGFQDMIPPFTPNGSGREGFYGGAARGAGVPDCLRTSSEGSALIALFSNRRNTVEEGADDLHELTQIVSKLSCFKKDLLKPSRIVDATRYQVYATSHDVEPVAETTGRCFAKTIPSRDFEIIFDKWTSRGMILIRRLCTATRMSTSEVEEAEKLFQALLRDVKDVARGACFDGEPSIAGKPGPRDPHPYVSQNLEELGPYTGYY